VIHPATGAMSKATGRAVAQRFGPVQHCAASYSGAEPAIMLCTAAAEYMCVKPSGDFRALFTDAQEQVQLCHTIVHTLKGKEGSSLTFEAILAAINRAKVVKGYMSVRDAVLLSAPFILSQMPAMQKAVGSEFVLADCKFCVELMEEVCLARDHV
jgi:Cytosine specific DNA methyltransferase replication foci domain